MDKKILILKNDRVGDFFHSLRNIKLIKDFYSNHKIEIYLSKINIRFSSVFNSKELILQEVSYNLSTLEKLKLFYKLMQNDYEYVFILSPKNFYFYLPLIFRKIKFLALCVDGKKRKRPNTFLRKYLFKFIVNDRSKNIKKLPIYEMEKKLLENIMPITKSNKRNDYLKYDPKGKRLNALFHYKSEIFGNINDNIDQFNNFFSHLVRKFNIHIKISTDIELNSSSKELFNAFKNNHNIKFLGPVDAESLMKEIGDSDLIISPHGAISCIAGYYNKNIIDIFDRTITRNAFSEFKPYTNSYYQFIFKSLDLNKTFLKIMYKINNIYY